MSQVQLINHPLVLHRLSQMRKKETTTADFRNLLKEISLFIAYEVSKNFLTELKEIETPLCKTQAPFLKEKSPVIISILRAGNGLLDGFLKLIPDSKVGYIGLAREEKAKDIIEYYYKVPSDMSSRRAIIIDPMLATAKSSLVAIDRIKSENPLSLDFVCLLASKKGIELLEKNHPDIRIFTAAIDPILDEKSYIVPGLGDAGDRLFGTL